MHSPQTLHDDGWRGTADRKAIPLDPTTPERERKLKAALAGLPAKSRVLDFGCGRGHFTAFLARLGLQATGIDLSDSAIALNRADYPNLLFETVQPDAPTPFPDGLFAAIWSSEVIEHVYDVHGTFAEWSRLLQPGGKLILTTPYHGPLKNLLLVIFAFDAHFNVEWQHIRFWSRRSLTKVATAHQLWPVKWDFVGRSWLFPKSFVVTFEKR